MIPRSRSTWLASSLWRATRTPTAFKPCRHSLWMQRRLAHDVASASSSRANEARRWTRSQLSVVGAVSVACGLLGYALRDAAGGGKSKEEGPAYDVLAEPRFGSPRDFVSAIEELKSQFADDEDAVSTDPDDLHAHGFSDNDYHPGAPHSVIVYPKSTEDVVKLVKIATKYRMPVVPFSGHTSLEGHTSGASSGSICCDVSHMDRILAIHEDDCDLVCQSGALYMDINLHLEEKGIPLFFPIDPGPGASIGGMLSTGCSGTNAVRYGTAKGEWFLNATVVLPSGQVIKTRQRARKSAAGFDTTKLFIGAEGTLGIVTEVTIRLAPVLPTTVAVVHFPDVQKATEAVIDVMKLGVGIQCVELVDNMFMRGTNQFGGSSRKWPEKDSLFFKFQGPNDKSLAETAKAVKRVVETYGGTNFTLAKDQKEAKELWSDRKNALWSGLALVEGARGWSTDVCVPISNLPKLIMDTKQDLAGIGLVSTIVGHVGDGNFHALLLFTNDKEFEIAKDAVHRMVERALALDGTCTGEHGVGIGKREYLYDELGVGTVELMKTIKRAIDPQGIFNPGKLYPDSPRHDSTQQTRNSER